MALQDAEALKITLATISEAHAICKQHGIQLVVVFAPTKFRVYANLCRFEKGFPIQGWVINPLPDILAKAIRDTSEEIGFLDLTPDLKQAAASGPLLYYPDDTHWSPEGHEVAARRIAKYLKSQYGELLERKSAAR